MKVEIELEIDGRWIAEIPEPPGVLVFAERPENDEAIPKSIGFSLFPHEFLAIDESAGCSCCQGTHHAGTKGVPSTHEGQSP